MSMTADPALASIFESMALSPFSSHHRIIAIRYDEQSEELLNFLEQTLLAI
jgi:hypothetical protein